MLMVVISLAISSNVLSGFDNVGLAREEVRLPL
jgi:hypothetical protein